MRPRGNHGFVPPAGLSVSAAPGGTEAVAAAGRFAAVWWASAAPIATWWHQLQILGGGDEVVDVRERHVPRTGDVGVVGASDGDGHLPSGVALPDVAESFSGLAERVGPVDDRRDLAGLDEFLQRDKVFSALFRVEGPQRLASEERQQARLDDAT